MDLFLKDIPCLNLSFCRKIRNRWLWMCLILITPGSSFGQNTVTDTSTIAFVNNVPVTIAEFMQPFQRLRSQIISFYRTRYNCEYDNEFWTRNFDGQTPSEMLKEKVMDTVVRIKIQQICAKEYGIVSDVSYQGFLKNLDNENKRRSLARNNNEVIYGPVQYSERVYYNYLLSNMENHLKRVLDENVFRIDETMLKEEYERSKDSLFLRGFYTEVRLIRLKIKNGVKPEINDSIRQYAYKTLSAIGKNIHNDLSLLKLKEQIGSNQDFSIDINEITYNDSIYSPEEDDATSSVIKENITELDEGEQSRVIEQSGNFYLIYIKEKRSLGYRSFENCRNTIKTGILNKLYNRHINELQRCAELRINQEVYQNFNIR